MDDKEKAGPPGEEILAGLQENQIDKADYNKGKEATEDHESQNDQDETNPWPEPIDGAELLTSIQNLFTDYVSMSTNAAATCALFVNHTYAFEAATHSPILAILSPEKRCGKTTLLSLFSRLVTRPLPTSNTSAAAVYRLIDKETHMLILDEADTFLNQRGDEFRGIINSGHSKDLAYVTRCVGEQYHAKQFSTWCPKILAQIGSLPPTLADRSIEINLQRKLPTDSVQRLLPSNGADVFTDIQRKCRRFTEDNMEHLRIADPEFPPGLHDRARDNWRPLFAIADVAGPEWSARVRKIATEIDATGDDDSPAIDLLSAIRDVFHNLNGDRISSQDLVDELRKLEVVVTPALLARRLVPFGIRSKSIRIGDRTPKGYMATAFTDAFARYLPDLSATPQQPTNDGACSVDLSATQPQHVADDDANETT